MGKKKSFLVAELKKRNTKYKYVLNDYFGWRKHKNWKTCVLRDVE
jgi:hypothetical protein